MQRKQLQLAAGAAVAAADRFLRPCQVAQFVLWLAVLCVLFVVPPTPNDMPFATNASSPS